MRNWSYAYVLLVFFILINPNQKFKGIFIQNLPFGNFSLTLNTLQPFSPPVSRFRKALRLPQRMRFHSLYLILARFRAQHPSAIH